MRRALRILLYILLVPAWVMLAFISFDSLGGYTEVGNVTLLAAWMLFALWAWWYGEDRDRRRAARAAHRDGAGSADHNGS